MFTRDSQEKHLFLQESLKQDDISFFKKDIKEIMKNSGFNYSKRDTVEVYRSSFDDLIVAKGLSEWIIKTSNKLYLKWIKKNPVGFYVHNYADYLITVDYNEHYKTLCIEYMAELATFCNALGGLPNNIDHGVDILYKWDIVFMHALKNSVESLNYTWNVFQHHIDKAYFEGKIGANLYQMYDLFLYQYTGF